jgi:hypothetical protein
VIFYYISSQPHPDRKVKPNFEIYQKIEKLVTTSAAGKKGLTFAGGRGKIEPDRKQGS